ncbi:MAG: hypothetical protein ACI37Q_01950 [Candidatus Gastranaerophilaceae bacterium]
MFFVYDIPNVNPSLGPVKGEKQDVSVYDRDLGNRRTVTTTPEEADDFVKTRTQVVNSATKRGWGLAALATATGAAIGAGVETFSKVGHAKKLNELVEPLNKGLAELLESGKSLFSAKFDLLEKDAFKKFSFELRELFSEDAKMFKPADIMAVAKRAMKSGAIGGAVVAAIFAWVIPLASANNADKKITQEFIDANK